MNLSAAEYAKRAVEYYRTLLGMMIDDETAKRFTLAFIQSEAMRSLVDDEPLQQPAKPQRVK